MGNPAVELKVDFDTGSTNMWIVKTCESMKSETNKKTMSDCYSN